MRLCTCKPETPSYAFDDGCPLHDWRLAQTIVRGAVLPGMTLRDVFALMYMHAHAGFVGVEESTRSSAELRKLPRRAYQIADHMLAARSASEEGEK